MNGIRIVLVLTTTKSHSWISLVSIRILSTAPVWFLLLTKENYEK